MSATGRQRLSAPLRRDQILDVAWQIIAADGFPALTMDRLAREAGITRTLIYQQFGNLSAVLVALLDREYGKEAAQFLQAVARHPGSGIDQFVAVMTHLLEAVDANPVAWQIFLKTPEGCPPEVHERLAQGRSLTRQVLAQSLRMAENTGVLTAGNPDFELNVRTMQVLAEELLRLRLDDPEHFSHARLLAQVRALSKSLFRG